MKVTAVVVRAEDDAILVLPSGLPQVSLEHGLWFPDVEKPQRAFREQLEIDGYVLVCLAYDESADETAYLMVSVDGRSPDGGRWVADAAGPLVAAARQHLALPADHPVTPRWTKPRWYAEALPWIDEELAAAGSPRTGVPVQVRSWGLSNVLRCPTTEGDVYFKAVAHSSTIRPARVDAPPLLFAHEPRLLQRLSEERPGQVVAPLAIDEDRAWMLLTDLGPPLAAHDEVELWIEALRSHARLQLSYADSPERLLSFSCVDRRLEVLDAEIERLLGDNPLTVRLDDTERDKLPQLAPVLRKAIAELASIGLPETLVHGDLHPRNLAVHDGRVLAFDWTDAALAHPFLDLVTFFEQRSAISADPRLKDVYLAEWEELATPAELRRALSLAEQLGALHQTMTYLHLPEHLSGPSRDSMLRGGVSWIRKLLEQ